MSPPAGEHASARDSEVHVIDIDSDIDYIIGITDKPELPVVHEKSEAADMNGNGTMKETQKPKPVNIAQAVQKARDTFNEGITLPMEWRKKQLKSLLRMYEENRMPMAEALYKDLRRSKLEAMLLEVDILINELRSILHSFQDWAKPDLPSKDLVNILDEVIIHKEPYGVVLVIGAWNYPIQLSLMPMAGAIAAGNTVVIKPSELAVHCAEFVVETLPKYMDSNAVVVIEGGPEETTELLKQRFDYIFFTGGTGIGKVIYEAATKYLTPVTLELGGKSPVYVDNTVDMEVAVKRILWGKLINAGQTCIAPDYILCTKEVQEKFLFEAKKVLKEWYGDDVQKSPDFARIINTRHTGRLQAVIDASRDKIAIGGSCDISDKYIEPTIIANVSATDLVMKDEIFGPILPIVNIENAYEAIKFIKEREKPLVMYVFTTNKKVLSNIVDNTSSGGMCVNDTMMQMGVETIPFGGVGSSGMGAYHGKSTFDTFTHKKGCLVRNFFPLGEKLGSARYPPYTEGNLKLLTLLTRKRFGPSLRYLPYLLAFALGAGLSYGIFAWQKSLDD